MFGKIIAYWIAVAACGAVVFGCYEFWLAAQPLPRCRIVGDHEIVTRHCIPYCPPNPKECD